MLIYREQAIRICEERMNGNVEFIRDILMKNLSKLTFMSGYTSNKYMLLRHEDVSLHPTYYARQVNNFIGHDTDNSMMEWLKKATAYSRDSKKSKMFVNKWRNQITFMGNEIAQEVCNKSLHFFGYKQFSLEQQLTLFVLLKGLKKGIKKCWK